jgi:hypothetical protein
MKRRGSSYTWRRLNVPLGNVAATRLFCVRIACQCKGACTRTAADFLEFTLPALPLQVGGVSQTPEESRFAVEAAQFLLADVARRHRQESARKYFSGVGDEDKTLAVIEAARRPPKVISGLVLDCVSFDASLMRGW